MHRHTTKTDYYVKLAHYKITWHYELETVKQEPETPTNNNVFSFDVKPNYLKWGNFIFIEDLRCNSKFTKEVCFVFIKCRQEICFDEGLYSHLSLRKMKR